MTRSLSSSRQTQELLNGLYTMVTPVLVERFTELRKRGDEELATLLQLAAELGIEANDDLPQEDLDVIDDIAWRRVARGCVIATVRVVATHDERTASIISLADLPNLVRQRTDLATLAADTGLSEGDAGTAVRVTAEVLGASPIFKTTRVFRIDDQEFAFRVMEDKLYMLRPRAIRVALEGSLADIRTNESADSVEVHLPGSATIEAVGWDPDLVSEGRTLRFVERLVERDSRTHVAKPFSPVRGKSGTTVRVTSSDNHARLAFRGRSFVIESLDDGVLLKEQISDDHFRVINDKVRLQVEGPIEDPLDVQISATVVDG